MRRLRVACFVVALAGASCTSAPSVPSGPEIETSDVALFYRLYDATDGHPTAARVQRDYLDAGSDGLRTFARLRGTTAARIVDAIAQQPQLYAGARRCAAVLPAARRRLVAVMARLRALYPAVRMPPVTVAIGRGRPVGIGSPVNGLQIGLEALCGVAFMDADLEDRVVHVVAHEYVHVQQRPELVDDPDPTVLEGALVEGAAEFVGELISGGVSYARQAASVRGREAEIEQAFVADMHQRDLSRWLYNGTMEQPGDLGYWVGYRIVERYYDGAADKQAAIREILEMRDPEAFLVRSGWQPAR